MRKVLWLMLVCYIGVESFENENFPPLEMEEILKNVNYKEVSPKCYEHLQYFSEGLSKMEQWALNMFDSITKFPDGIFLGHNHILGHFDECVDVVHPLGLFKGKHCMTEVYESSSGEKNKILPYPFGDENEKNQKFLYGICVPSTCTSEDVKNFINSGLMGSPFKVELTENGCSTNEYRPFRPEDWVTVVVIMIVVLMAVGSTTYEYLQRNVYKNETPNNLLCSFSLITNGKLVFRISQNTAQLKCLHGIRFLSITWVVLGHTYIQTLMFSPVNPIQLFQLLKKTSFIPVSNAFVSVDSFFLLSGLLVCVVFFRDISKKKTFDVPVAFIHRYMRLTPPFAILILIQSTIVSRLGNGPLWNKSMDAAEQTCRESWWAGLTYIQNYAKPTSMCLGQSWYLSADMQMYWISPLLLYPLLLFPAFAVYILIFAVLVAAFTNFAIAFVNDLTPNFSMNPGPNSMRQFELEYSPFHTRMAPWIIGLATGYIICGLQAKKIRLNLPKHWVIIGWLTAFALLGGSLFGIARFINNDYDKTEASFYLAFHRVGWALGLSWVVIACVAGYGGLVNSFLSIDYFQPLGKLSYCIFLTHMTLQSIRYGSSRINLYIRNLDLVYNYLGDLLFSTLASIPMALLFETPFTHIDRHFFQKLVIFPYPRPKEKLEEKIEKPVTSTDDVEIGRKNPAFEK